ncbi:sigma-54-dependent Fis family transcriptional regulator [Vreelandella nigrificans]|uniref:Sigma-54-dependent Fis family transcriptional regulator n=1 Tax=Vreelandella nigrificans TaxID=2042704 RepID=A0A2A4HF71_9GAMM|nr:sigma-54-dependent Fis family transcriptional regulator [Halomonas nigrificans]PCF93478.1 sigma-54-dependent Fis family transcriptional regulator [Halomonas nigrificans]
MSTQLTPFQRLSEARKTFFQEGNLPTGLIDEAILSSWKRCIDHHKSVTERVVYESLPRSSFKELINVNRKLTEAANEPLEQLHRTVSGAGYALLLTDHIGHALNTYQASSHSDKLIKQAFRPGVNLSEQYIGTSAMSCALTEGRPITVSGPEHYFSVNQRLNCAAAPIIAPNGQIIGSIDITREYSLAPGSALALVTHCARAIEGRLLTQLAPYLILQLSWQQQEPATCDMLIALGPEGEILGMTPKVREVAGLSVGCGPANIQELFDLRFGDLVDASRGRRSPLLGQIHSGLSFALYPSLYKKPSLIEGTAQSNSPRTEPISKTLLPSFGDASLAERFPLALRAMNKGLPILIQGETGTGKEVMAKALHDKSNKRSGKFVAINCAAIPETLIEGELFGHTDGAYTGARRGGAPGKIEQANGGTLFLDEIGDMPLALQSRLLRVLESQEVTRLGDSTTKQLNFQLLCATHRDLNAAVARGEFRDDLLYRVKGMPLWIPPLRERSELCEFLSEQCDQVTEGRRQLTQDVLKILKDYDWPGNVRELRHALTHADVLAEDSHDLILPCYLPADIVKKSSHRTTLLNEQQLGTLKSLELEAIEEALEQASGDVNKAAKRLGIGRATFYRKLKEIRSSQ